MTIMKARKQEVIEQNESEEENETMDEQDHNSSDESGQADDEISENETEELQGTSNAGWADSISKILKTNKPKKKKTIVLSKAKKLTDVKKLKPKPVGFEVQTAEGKVHEEKIEIEIKDTADEPTRKKKRELPNLRVKPNILEKDRERTLQKIATKGVVQLFNAVKSQQKEISQKLKEAGPLEVRKEKVLKNIDKRTFLDVLSGEKSLRVEDDIQEQKKRKVRTNGEVVTDTTWSVLKEDFMMSAKMKDWDKELEGDELEEEHNLESD